MRRSPGRHAGERSLEADIHKGRREAFSDGVLAIIITIMVLELRVPAQADIDSLLEAVPRLLTQAPSGDRKGIASLVADLVALAFAAPRISATLYVAVALAGGGLMNRPGYLVPDRRFARAHAEHAG